ncbi:CYFA0S03e05864g1_1 [Cyberlindnera fabianii]|uniref:CYFA0S03e05864g1_1 n=1 Tax=Cyberlindnera fabianii TaxID=36022 RepID=A0A061AY51_CYBFA|nr:CYFA0S03e05864g1_1 [Cyberlindnera fabianii]
MSEKAQETFQRSSSELEEVSLSNQMDPEKSGTPISQQNTDEAFPTDEELKERTSALAAELNINQTKLMWKIDLCVVPAFVVLYFLAFLDRINISNAKVYGMAEDLNLVGNQFNIALTVFFVPYIFFEVASNYFMKKVPPHIWLSACILAFGAITLGLGYVKNFSGLVACRFFLGMMESATFPGIFYVLSTYYTKLESQQRFSAFFSCTCLAGASGGAMAYRIHDLDGVHGLASWQWIFIIEGAFTMGLAFVLYFIIPDFPESARFLNDNERDFLKRKLELNSVSSGFETKYNWRDVAYAFFHDPLFIITAFCYFCLIVPSYGYAYFAPTIINQMGYTAVAANQHSVYPWLLAFGVSNIVAFFSDRTKIRLPYAIVCSAVAVVGLSLVLGLTDNPQGRYAGCFLTAAGLYTAMPQLVCLTSLNFGGHLRKSLGTAFQVGFGNIGGIIATFIFLAPDAPVYKKGLGISIAFGALSIIVFFGLWALLIYRNNKKLTTEYREKFFAQSEKDITLQGDKHPSFKYMY